MSTFSDMKYALDEIARKNARGRQLIGVARKELIRVQSDLSGMTEEYSAMVTAINQAAINNPTDEIYLMTKKEKDKLVADFQNLKIYADDLITAFDAVVE